MKKMTLNNIYEWPLMTRLLALGLIFAATVFLGYHFDVARQATKLSSVIQEESDLRQQLEIVIHRTKLLQSEISHLPELKKQLQNWKTQMVSNADMADLLNQILKTGADNHLFFSLFTPLEPITVKLADTVAKPDTNTGTGAAAQPAAPAAAAAPQPAGTTPPAGNVITYEKIPIKVVVVGSFHQIADFISQIANMQAIVVIGNFTISNENKIDLLGDKLAKQAVAQHLLSAEMTLEVYRLAEGK
jgi:type IV pilus assembly protein PilO